MGASDTEERVLLDLRFGSGSPTTWYWGALTTMPNDDGSGYTEPSGNGYARVPMTNNTTNFPAATTTSGVSRKSNGSKITYPNPTGPWGLIVGWGAFLGSSGGVPSYFNLIDASISPKAGNTPVEFDVNTCYLTAD